MSPRGSEGGQARGEEYELLACRHLERHGLRLLERNYRVRCGELDLVMADGSVIVFVEVRYRRSTRYGGALASIDVRKQRRLILAAQHYLQARRLGNRPCRFDVVAIGPGAAGMDVHWITNAFETT